MLFKTVPFRISKGEQEISVLGQLSLPGTLRQTQVRIIYPKSNSKIKRNTFMSVFVSKLKLEISGCASNDKHTKNSRRRFRAQQCDLFSARRTTHVVSCVFSFRLLSLTRCMCSTAKISSVFQKTK